MATYLIIHEVDDVQHWLASSKREEVFGPQGITVQPFTDTDGSGTVGLLADIPDLEAFGQFMQTEAAQEAARHDGVRLDTLVVLAAA